MTVHPPNDKAVIKSMLYYMYVCHKSLIELKPKLSEYHKLIDPREMW